MIVAGALATVSGAVVLLPARGAAAAENNPAEEIADLVAPVDEATANSQVRRGLAYPFHLGVASGDPTPDGFVIWTRLAPVPLSEDGRGGMPDGLAEVLWEVAEDSRFRRLARVGQFLTHRGEGHSVHVEVAGLAPGRAYFYRFRTGLHISPAGRARTAPAPGAKTPLDLAVTSCAHFEHGYFTAYRHVAQARPDVILHVGDYIYGNKAGRLGRGSDLVRRHAGGQTRTLADYRRRYAQYKTDPDLQAAHAAAPWIVTPDDHEVSNNWAGAFAAKEAHRKRFARRKQAALQAYWENMPLRRSARPADGQMQIYRRLTWGALATFHVVDTRQHRDAPPCDTLRARSCGEREAAGRQMLGGAQEAWLADSLARSGATWDLLAQQVLFSSTAPPGAHLNLDTWDGFAAARTRVLDAARRGGVRNLAVLTGDCHKHYAAHILRDFADLDLRPAGIELAATSVSSGGDGRADGRAVAAALAELPYLRFGDGRRGWVRVRATPAELRADFHVLDSVTKKNSPARRAASFAVESGSPLLHAL